jgi:phage terminase large subunit
MLIKAACLNKLQAPRYAYIAPLYRQAKQVGWDYLKFYAAPSPQTKINESELRVDLINGARISLYGADIPMP